MINIIRLFNSNEVNFQHNKHILSEATKCDITEYLNDTFELDLEYPINDSKGLSPLLTTNSIIKAPVGDSREDQLFVIRQPKQSISKTSRLVSAYGQHIAIDKLSKNIITSVSVLAKNRKDAISTLLSNTLYAHDFTVGNKDTNTSVATFPVTRVNPITAIMGSSESDEYNSTIANEYGGEIIFDNFVVDVVDERGEDNNVIVSYAKNITGVELETDDLDLVTDYVPVAKKADSTPLLLPEYHISSQYVDNYPDIYVNTLDVDVQVVEAEKDDDGNITNADDIVTIEQCYTKMREAVAYKYSTEKVDQLNFTLTVNFIELQNTIEYENYKDLQRIKQVGDYVTIKHKPLNLNLKGRVNKIVWDCLNLNKTTKKPKIKEIEIGFSKKTLTDIINKTKSQISNLESIATDIQARMYVQNNQLVAIVESGVDSGSWILSEKAFKVAFSGSSDGYSEITGDGITIYDGRFRINKNGNTVFYVNTSGRCTADGGFRVEDSNSTCIMDANGIKLSNDNGYSSGVHVHPSATALETDDDFFVKSDLHVTDQTTLESTLTVNSRINANGYLNVNDSCDISDDLDVGGAKNCLQTTENYGKRRINAYETAEYYFGDIGEGIIKNGECIVYIDDIFSECINTDVKYQVDIFEYTNRGSIISVERFPKYFIVKGNVDYTEFGWELKAKRKGYENNRLEKVIKFENDIKELENILLEELV